MNQLVILSGKGGTGKTSIAAAFAHLASSSRLAGKVVLADTDVDAANLELVLQPHLLEQQEFKGGKVAVIDQDACISCGDCQAICRFDAIDFINDKYLVDPFACDGCAACIYHCPASCINMQDKLAGRFYRSETLFGPLFHAYLFPGQENSGKLVTLVKQRARLHALEENYDLVIVDGPPGIGCPVIASVSGADLALIVAEPTIAGVHDMDRAIRTASHFNVRVIVCINKADIYTAGVREIEAYCLENNIEMAAKVPFDPTISIAMVAGKAVTEFKPDSPSSLAISALWWKVAQSLVDVKP